MPGRWNPSSRPAREIGPALLVCFTSRIEYHGRILLLGNVYEGLRDITHSLFCHFQAEEFFCTETLSQFTLWLGICEKDGPAGAGRNLETH